MVSNSYPSLAACGFVFVPMTIVPSVLMLLSFVIGLGVGCGQPLSMTLAYSAAPPGRAGESIPRRLAVSCGAHVFIPTAFGALGVAIGLAPVFCLCATALMGGSAINARHNSESL